MPELPEVEALRGFLGQLVGKRITRVEVGAISALKTFDPPIETLQDCVVSGVARQGKYLVFEVQPGVVAEGPVEQRPPALFLVLHLARAGWIKFHSQLKPGRTKPGRGPLALKLGFNDGSGIDITEAGTEKRLAFWLVNDVQSIEHVATLGPDPLDPQVSEDELVDRLTANKGQVKKVLTSQQVIAGVGNAYSDEALHVAKLSPFKLVEKMSDEELHAVVQALRMVLSDAVARSAELPAAGLKAEKKSGLRVHGRKGEPCGQCGDVIREVSFATKSLQYCPTCQTGGKPLADRRLSRLLK